MRSARLDSAVAVHKALGHPGRARILAMLRGGELCVCQITAVLRVAPSTVSAHLAELRRADLIDERKDGRWVYYRLAVNGRAQKYLGLLWTSLGRDERIAADAALLAALRRVRVEDLCRAGLDLGRLGLTAARAPRARTTGGRRGR